MSGYHLVGGLLQQRKAADGDGKIVNSSCDLFLAEKASDMHKSWLQR